MARYALNLPTELKKEAEELAAKQGVSLNQFVLWSVAEKVGSLKGVLDDPAFPNITYRRGASGIPSAALRGTGIRVQTMVEAKRAWGMASNEIAEQYDLSVSQVNEALAFYEAHRNEVDCAIASEAALEADHGKTAPPPGR